MKMEIWEKNKTKIFQGHNQVFRQTMVLYTWQKHNVADLQVSWDLLRFLLSLLPPSRSLDR